jgi:hypothetical protein
MEKDDKDDCISLDNERDACLSNYKHIFEIETVLLYCATSARGNNKKSWFHHVAFFVRRLLKIPNSDVSIMTACYSLKHSDSLTADACHALIDNSLLVVET